MTDREKFWQASKHRFDMLVKSNPGDVEDWPDAAKLRLAALQFDKIDLEREVYDRTGMQDALRRMADRIEELGDAW